ncbi:MAG: TolC family protein, partial [Azonexus sp.]|nr:TolC family protein [Azonexus sp.]
MKESRFAVFGCRRGMLAALFALGAAGCAVGPDYARPALPPGAEAAAFKEQGGLWTPASPAVAAADGAWWRAYGDARLDALVVEANQANQTLALAAARYRQAEATFQGARAAYLPTVGVSTPIMRGRSISNGVSSVGNNHAWSLQASWEPDLWGAARRNVEAAGDEAAASAADLAAARLAVQAAVVNGYLQLRLT